MLNTRTTKCPRMGWDSVTSIEMPDPVTEEGKRVLEIHTYKSSKGGVQTYATVYRVKGGWKSHKIFEDYSVRVIYESAVRCTESNVRDQHRRALKELDNIRCDAAYHYEQLAAKQAAERAERAAA